MKIRALVPQPDGSLLEQDVELDDDHPAAAAMREGLLGGLSIGDEAL